MQSSFRVGGCKYTKSRNKNVYSKYDLKKRAEILLMIHIHAYAHTLIFSLITLYNLKQYLESQTVSREKDRQVATVPAGIYCT